MNTNQIFSVTSALAAGQWLLLILLPKWKLTQWLIRYKAVPLLLSVIYAVYIAKFFDVSGGGFGSLAQLRSLFANDNLLLAGWVHYLAFDMLVGFYMVTTARELMIPHWLLVPCLALTFLFGPLGFLLYQIIKKVKVTL